MVLDSMLSLWNRESKGEVVINLESASAQRMHKDNFLNVWKSYGASSIWLVGGVVALYYI